ncbi:MAG: phosphotransferase [Spirochaetia bacterium]|nr:phosphotransferase [Spirochaetia bacterium]
MMPLEGLDAFLSQAALGPDSSGPYELETIRQEVSSRSYHRIRFTQSGTSFVLCSGMNPAGESWSDFVTVALHFQKAGIPVPRIHAEEKQKGWLLLSDGGRDDLADELKRASGDEEQRSVILEKTVALLVQIHNVAPAAPVSTRRFDAPKLQWEIDFMLSKLEYAVRALGISFDVSFEFQMFLSELCDMLARHPDSVVTHRDFHARNVLVDADGRYTVIDFQDARMGLPWYDLASFLYDPYVEWTPDERRRGFQMYCEASGRKPELGLYLAQALQRVLKALGTYLWVTFEKGSDSHASFIQSSVARAEDIIQNARMPDSAFVFVSAFQRIIQPAIDAAVEGRHSR